MPFTYDSASGLFVTAVGTAVHALTVNRADRTGVIVQKYNGHNAPVSDLLVTMHMLFSCSDELICHNLGTGREKWRLLKEIGIPVAKLAVLGDILVCCLTDCSVAMVNIRRGVLLYYTPLKGERVGGIPYVAVDAFNRMAYVQGNRCVNGWSLAVGRRVFNTDLVVGQIYSSAHSAVYKILYGGAGDGGVRAYKVPTGETLWTALGHTENVNAIVASEHLELVISGSSDGTLRAWDIRNGTPRWSTVVFDDRAAITDAACAEWEGRIVVGGENGVLAMFDAYTGEQIWRTLPGPLGYLSLQIVASNSLVGILQRFSSGYMILTEDHDGSVVVRDLHSGRVQWSLEAPMQYSTMTQVLALSASSGGRACLGGIRSAVGLYHSGIVRVVDAHDGSTLWRSSGAGGSAVCYDMDSIHGTGIIVYGTDTGSVVALDETTGKRHWKVAGFGDEVAHVKAVRIFALTEDKKVVTTQALLTWSRDNVLRAWNLLTGERLWSQHQVDASVELCYSTGCPYVVCVGQHDLTTLNLENGQVFHVTHSVGDEDNPIVHATLSPRLQFSATMRSSGRKLSSRGSTRSATVIPVEDDMFEEAKPIEVVATDGTEIPSGIPALDLSSLPQSPSMPRGTSKTVMVACVLKNGDVFVVNAEDGDIPCAVSVPWAEEGDGSIGHIRPEAQSPLVALYDGVGFVGLSRKPLVVASLGSGASAFLTAWRVFDDNRNAWDIQVPNNGVTLLRCVGKWLYYCASHGVTIYDPVMGSVHWKLDAQREDMVAASLVTSCADPKPRRRGGWHVGDEIVHSIVFGSRDGGVFGFSTRNRESKMGDVTFLQIGACHDIDVYQDEIPSHPRYHPPGSGGLSGLLRTQFDTHYWQTHKWILASASPAHEWRNKVDFWVEALLWLVAMLQLSYFPLRAKFPPIMSAWQSLGATLATFDISSMSGADPFQPAYTKCIMLFLAVWVLATAQIWIMEWRTRNPLSMIRNSFVLAVQMFARMSYMILFIPVARMIIAPFICNVAIQRVSYQMMFAQNYFLEAFSPKTYTVQKPSPTAVSMGRDMMCAGGKYFSFVTLSILLLLLYLPLVCRLISVRGDLTLLRYSAQFRSAIGWWRDDDSKAALDVVVGRNHAFALKHRTWAVVYLVLGRIALLALAEMLLPPAAEFFLVMATCAALQFLLFVRPLFHDKLGNVLLKSANAVIVLLSALGWFSSVWVRPIGERGVARDAFITFLVIAGSPAVFICMLLEEQIRNKMVKHIGCLRRSQDKSYGPGGTTRRIGSQKSLLGTSSRRETETPDNFTS